MKSNLELCDAINIRWLCEMWKDRVSRNAYWEMHDCLHGWRMLINKPLTCGELSDYRMLSDVLTQMREGD